MPTRRQVLTLLAALPTLSLVACGGDRETAATACSPILLTDEHECALCGMTVVRFPGPKGQACLRDGRVLPFCSVQDLLAWSWQPESVPAIEKLYVHDLSHTGWDEPSDEAYMDAQAAVYVIGHDQQGAMGHSPAPFSQRADAEAFAERHGGRVMDLDQINWDNLRGNLG
ncbi:NosL family protein [Thioalkalivibrio denitrificans]|uniref:NosL family protein n=1 Tax=Thioalkalivibrio denitrificans TaxID=108003 RepID=A0A1V3NFS7_9GAMM|nr:nitrous oxide reductase accessory protein NosL [Thioalkalivibrio denitrificans]OOG23702.1 NosL family protein [Thioalkalivibrio denitrificans]